MNTVEIIETKRDGKTLNSSQIRPFIGEYAKGNVPDYQMAAFLMAAYIRGMSPEETISLTEAMLDSGKRIIFEGLESPPIDKHSTGGVGDKISIPLVPLVAACGVPVPMLSGRSLGHTGGTLDKLEAIPGFKTQLGLDMYRRGVREIGAVMMGQTEEIAPADRRIYALRDVTGTVPNVSLITASILSKKAAGGASGLVLDVKCGAGAFMTDLERARDLARSLKEVGEGLGLEVEGFITAMDQPIGRSVGNALEVREAVEVLKGEGPSDTLELTLTLGAAMLQLSRKVGFLEEGRNRLKDAISSGAGAEKLREIIRFQGGDPDVIDEMDHLPSAPGRQTFRSNGEGFLARLDARKVGLAAMALGAGRTRVEDPIDPAVGIELLKKCGAEVRCGEPIAIFHCGDGSDLESAQELFSEAIQIEGEAPCTRPLVIERLPGTPDEPGSSRKLPQRQ